LRRWDLHNLAFLFWTARRTSTWKRATRVVAGPPQIPEPGQWHIIGSSLSTGRIPSVISRLMSKDPGGKMRKAPVSRHDYIWNGRDPKVLAVACSIPERLSGTRPIAENQTAELSTSLFYPASHGQGHRKSLLLLRRVVLEEFGNGLGDVLLLLLCLGLWIDGLARRASPD